MPTTADIDAMHAGLDLHPGPSHMRGVLSDMLRDLGEATADGYAALAALARVPDSFSGGWCYWSSSHTSPLATIPQDWWFLWREVLTGIPPGPLMRDSPPSELPFRAASRRECEDAAALAFSRLPPERRVEILTEC